MKRADVNCWFFLRLIAIGGLLPVLIPGCNSSNQATDDVAAVETDADPGQAASNGHDHDGWWCPEHGVPEAECPLCDYSLVAEFKGKGDWCEEHQRPDSQCFECHPENREKFAGRYRAKFGENPPEIR